MTQNNSDKNPKRSKGKTGQKSTDKAIAAAVEKKVEAKLKAIEVGKTKEGEAEAFVISCLEKYASGKMLPPKPISTVTIAPVQATQATFLNGILRRSKNKPP
jgi:hypothetical protein